MALIALTDTLVSTLRQQSNNTLLNPGNVS